LLVGNSNFATWKLQLTDTVALNYGNVIKVIIDFLIVAVMIFSVLKVMVNAQLGIGKLTKKQKKAIKEQEASGEPAPEPVKIESTEDILKDIRALLEQQSQKDPTKAE
jgi:large conductance mechanosensitive channel